MSDYLGEKVLLVGAGTMAVDYANVLLAQGIPFDVIGRGQNSAMAFKEKTGIPVYTGGLEIYLNKLGRTPLCSIVAVGVEQLAPVTTLLLKNGVKRILVEKPAGLNLEEIIEVANLARIKDSEVYVAYNRRFYASTQKALEIIDQDGGLSSFCFEFTEWSHIIKDLKKAHEIKEQWFLANSTHVVDLAFFMGGVPKEISCFTAGGLQWHPSASVFTGAGVTEKGALFSYHANWEAPGRWGVELLTCKHRLILRPLEQLQIQKIGSVSIEKLDLDDEIDQKFKPGLYRQVESFIQETNHNCLVALGEHCRISKDIYSSIGKIESQKS